MKANRRFTGFKDFDDKPIFEGDIIELSYSYGHERDSTGDIYGEFKVVYNNGEFFLIDLLHYEDDQELKRFGNMGKDSYLEEFKVIRNIFENEKHR